MHFRRQRGATLIELVFVMIVFLILTMIATPYLGTFLQSQRVKNAAMDLSATVAYARSEAIKRNAQVDVTATGSGWSDGWSVTTGGASVRAYAAPDRVRIAASGNAVVLSFGSAGRLATPALSFQLQPVEANSKQPPLCVAVETTGRVHTTAGACP